MTQEITVPMVGGSPIDGLPRIRRSPFHAPSRTPGSGRALWLGVLVISCLVLVVTMSFPFASGFHPAVAPNGQLLEARTVQMSQGTKTGICGGGGWGALFSWPCIYSEPASLFEYGGVLFIFGLGNDSPSASPTNVWVYECWGGNYSILMSGPGWWVSPDGLSGIQSSGGSSVTLFVAIAELSYGLPTAPGALVFGGNVAILLYALFVLYIAPMRKRSRHSPGSPM